MPTIAIIAGVRLAIHLKDHLPPHLHAIFGEYEAQISILTGDILEGKLPPAKRKAVTAWIAGHREEIAYVWSEIQLKRYAGGRIDQ